MFLTSVFQSAPSGGPPRRTDKYPPLNPYYYPPHEEIIRETQAYFRDREERERNGEVLPPRYRDLDAYWRRGVPRPPSRGELAQPVSDHQIAPSAQPALHEGYEANQGVSDHQTVPSPPRRKWKQRVEAHQEGLDQQSLATSSQACPEIVE